MSKVCKRCKSEVTQLIDGLCIDCLSLRAEREQRDALDMNNDTPNIQINEPLGDDFGMVFACGQGNFKRKVNADTKDNLSSDSLKKTLNIHNEKAWSTVKPLVDYMVNKYEKQLKSGELKLMRVDEATMNFMATHESNKQILEVKGCIAIYKEIKE